MAENTLYLDWARDVLDTEAEGLREIAAALDHDFVRAAEALLHCKGRVVITGMGKSGHIGRKMAATMASTGTPAFFVHPAEAAHGDLGMIVDHDVVVAISNSGESDEIAAIIPALKRKNITLICITAHPTSTMARHADIHITAAVSKEACPLGLAPTSSTTAVMALGDALAVVLLQARAFTPDDFALSHPAGSLGKRLLLRVADIMHKDEALPAVLLAVNSTLRVANWSVSTSVSSTNCSVMAAASGANPYFTSYFSVPMVRTSNDSLYIEPSSMAMNGVNNQSSLGAVELYIFMNL